MSDLVENLRGIPFGLEDHVAYAEGSVVSKTLLQKAIGKVI